VINSAVELGSNFTDKISQFYHSSVIGFTLASLIILKQFLRDMIFFGTISFRMFVIYK